MYCVNGVNLRYANVRFAGTGTFDDNSSEIWHSQFTKCGAGVYSLFPKLYNVLFDDCLAAVYDGNGWEGEARRIEHVTANACSQFWSGGSSLNSYLVNNSIFTAVTVLFDSGITPSYSPWQVNLSSSSGVYRTGAGAGHRYLLDNSSYKDVGIPSINTALLEDLKSKTVFGPPSANILDNTTIANGTTWSPSVERDGDNQPDLGYHYDPLDYCVSRATISGTLTVNPGTAIGFFGTYGFQNGTLNIQGNPLNRSKVAHFTSVQEQSAAWGANASASCFLKSGSMPTTTATFTDITTAGGPKFTDSWVNTLTLTHSSLYGVRMNYYGGIPIIQAFTNNIIQRGTLDYGYCSGSTYEMRFVNNLFLNSSLSVGEFCNVSLIAGLTVRNNLFAKSIFTRGTSSGYAPTVTHNGFHSSTVTSQGSSAKNIGTLDFVPGTFYYPTTGGNLSQLIDAGAGIAAGHGLFHFTTTQSQQKDGFSAVDIGMHYVALNGNLATSVPLDADNDNTSDYLEDANGNGLVDLPSEQSTPWFNSVGEWSTPFDMTPGGRAVHATLLPTEKVVVWPDNNNPMVQYDPDPNSATPISTRAKADFNVFCTGHTLMQDGSLFVAGGHWETPSGLRTMAAYSPLDNFWTRLPIMTTPRWYPSCVTLDSGEILITGGTYGTGNPQTLIDDNDLPQVWNPTTGLFRDLTSALKKVRFYPYMFQHPAGGVFYAGPELLEESGDDRLKTLKLSTTTPGSWTDLGQLAEHREHSAPVMYEPGKILVAGGCGHWNSGLPEKTAEVIDLNLTTPVWSQAQDMHYNRIHQNGTLLPDGAVLITGGHQDQTATLDGYNPYPKAGTRIAAFGNPEVEVSVRTPELWGPNPLNPTQAPSQWEWTKMAECPSYRGYHSTALLLPDGRVLSAGGDFSYPYGSQNAKFDGEIFTPPYLLKGGSRPVITHAPKVISYGNMFTVQTASSDTILKVTLVRLGSVTHSFNANQRFLKLNFTGGNGSLQVTAPPNAQQCPPGHYMLFVINNAGVPSVAKMVQVLPASAPEIVMVCPANAGFVSPGDIKISAAVKNASDVASVKFYQNVGGNWTQIGSTVQNSQALDGNRHYSITWNQPVQAQYTIKATATKTDNAQTQVDSAPFTFTVRSLPSYSLAMSFSPPTGGSANGIEHYSVPVQVSADGTSSGSITMMEIYANRPVESARAGVKVAQRTASPASPMTAYFTWPFVQSGQNTLARLARDDAGIEQMMIGSGGGVIQVFGGALDTTFSPAPPNGTVKTVAVQSDGKILIGGDFTTVDDTARSRIARLNSDGSLDTTFIPGLGANAAVNTIAVQKVVVNGNQVEKILIGGAFTTVDGTGLARLNENGSLDTGFNVGVNGGTATAVHSIVVQNDGKILVGGDFTDAIGYWRNCIMRLNSDGSVDTGFNPNVTGGTAPVVYSVALQTDGKVLVGGNFTTVGGQMHNHVARLDTGGIVESGFNPGAGPNGLVRSVAVDNEGRVIIGGDFTTVNLIGRNRVARLSAGGALDTSFQNPGVNGPVHSVVALPHWVAIAGEFTSVNGTSRNRIARLLRNNGALDDWFRPSKLGDVAQHGPDNAVRSMALQVDGMIMIGGDFTTYTVPGTSQPLGRGPRVARIGGL